MCFGERSGSFASHKQVIVERLQILTVGIAREVVVLLSFSSICRESRNGKPEVIKSIPMTQNDETKRFMDVCGSFSKHL
jgi:hypothetical protein